MFDQCRQWLGPNQPGINQPETACHPVRRRRRPEALAHACHGEPVLDYLLGQ